MKLFYIILLLAIVSCSKKEQEAVVQQNLSEPHKATEDSITSVSIQKGTVKDTQGNLTPDETAHIKKFVTPYKFNAFKVEMYTGKLADPNFEGNPYEADKKYVEFITKGCKNNGINFAGKYTIIYQDCGAMSLCIHMVDRTNGEILSVLGLKSKDGDGRYGFIFKEDSKMIIANSELFTNDSMTIYTDVYGSIPEVYVWKAKRFRRLQ